MYFPPGYLSRAHASLVVSAVILAVGILVVGADASDTELQIVGGTAFVSAIVTLMFLLDRLEHHERRDNSER
jgi:hypothetical protein